MFRIFSFTGLYLLFACRAFGSAPAGAKKLLNEINFKESTYVSSDNRSLSEINNEAEQWLIQNRDTLISIDPEIASQEKFLTLTSEKGSIYSMMELLNYLSIKSLSNETAKTKLYEFVSILGSHGSKFSAYIDFDRHNEALGLAISNWFKKKHWSDKQIADFHTQLANEHAAEDDVSDDEETSDDNKGSYENFSAQIISLINSKKMSITEAWEMWEETQQRYGALPHELSNIHVSLLNQQLSNTLQTAGMPTVALVNSLRELQNCVNKCTRDFSCERRIVETVEERINDCRSFFIEFNYKAICAAQLNSAFNFYTVHSGLLNTIFQSISYNISNDPKNLALQLINNQFVIVRYKDQHLWVHPTGALVRVKADKNQSSYQFSFELTKINPLKWKNIAKRLEFVMGSKGYLIGDPDNVSFKLSGSTLFLLPPRRWDQALVPKSQRSWEIKILESRREIAMTQAHVHLKSTKAHFDGVLNKCYTHQPMAFDYDETLKAFVDKTRQRVATFP